MHPYKTEETALKDVINLSRAMSYKAALAGLDVGGGKSVIIGDPDKDKTPEMFRSFGIHVNSLGGRYIAAKDMGIQDKDLQFLGEKTSYVLGRPKEKGGSGDPSFCTARGIYEGMKTAVKWKLKKDSLQGLKIIVQGTGSVGRELVKHLVREKAEVLVSDIRSSVLNIVKKKFPSVKIISQEEIFSTPCDVFSPCALGSIINKSTVKNLDCSIIAGGANNQLSSPAMGQKLFDRGILYVPDFVINSGGLIFVYSYLHPKKSSDWLEQKIQEIPASILKICKNSKKNHTSTTETALQLAQEIIHKKTEKR